MGDVLSVPVAPEGGPSAARSVLRPLLRCRVGHPTHERVLCAPGRLTLDDGSAHVVRRRAGDKWAAVGTGLLCGGLGLLAGDPHQLERRVFHVVNRSGGSLSVLRASQDLGTLRLLLPAMTVLGRVGNRPHLVASAAFALPMTKAAELVAKRVVSRRRPAEMLDLHPQLRGGVPARGSAYPSGHAAIATCGVVLAAPYLPTAATLTFAGTATLISYARVQQGAHLPLDALGGVLLGGCVGSFANFTVGLRR
jgi:undecaprenyl-diphosphatase